MPGSQGVRSAVVCNYRIDSGSACEGVNKGLSEPECCRSRDTLYRCLHAIVVMPHINGAIVVQYSTSGEQGTSECVRVLALPSATCHNQAFHPFENL